MVAVQRGLLVLMAAGALALPSQVPIGSEGAGSPVKKNAPREAVTYAADQREAYLTPDQLDYIRPGLKVTINSVASVEAGKKPVVDFSIADDFGNPLDRTGATTVGTVTYRFVVATWDGLYYTNQIGIGGNPGRDNTGTTQTIDIGHYKYTFFNAMPSTFDASKPATLFGGFVRNTSSIVGKNYYVQAFKDFVPSTGAAATTWGQTTTARCNQCHTPDLGSTVSPHGGNYREAKTCALCHNPNNMVGQIPGSGGEPAEERSVYSGPHFWHLVHSEQWEGAAEITYPQDIRKCTTCHDATAKMGKTWMTEPTRAACGGCHTSVNFATGAGHSDANLPQANDSACATCHVPDSGSEWDASVKGAHTVPSDSTQLKGLNITILSVTNVGPGKKPTVTFKVTEDSGAVVKPNTTGLTLSLLLGGTTADYFAQPTSESATGAAFDAATGVCTYTFTKAIPADATGSWTIAGQSRRTITLTKAVGGTISYTEGAENPIFDVAVTGTVKSRRVSVALAKCNVCHYQLANLFSHGGQRISIQFCVMCHNPNASDAGPRTAGNGPPPAESISLARMIHRIHTGEELTQEYSVYGHSNTPTPFNEVTYPGDRRNCLACHANAAAYVPPVASGALNTVALRDYFSPQGPATAACLGCHDNRDAAAHAYLNTAPFGEACGTCHAAGGDWAPDKVHAY
jgi:OmcA/MtrC family decaheme c-type cytochrome